jgi:hypothetical protein
MNLSELVSAVSRVLKDASILRSEIIKELNQQQIIAVSRVQVPTLITADKITLPAGVIAGMMPANYQHGLVAAYSETTDKWLIIRTNTKALYADYSLGYLSNSGLPFTAPFTVQDASTTATGPIDECAVEGIKEDTAGALRQILWVRPATCQEETIQVRYYRKPVDMAADADVPDGLNEELQRRILVSGALVEKLPESALEVQRIKELMALHASRYADGMADLMRLYPYSPKHTPKPRRRVREF